MPPPPRLQGRVSGDSAGETHWCHPPWRQGISTAGAVAGGRGPGPDARSRAGPDAQRRPRRAPATRAGVRSASSGRAKDPEGARPATLGPGCPRDRVARGADLADEAEATAPVTAPATRAPGRLRGQHAPRGRGPARCGGEWPRPGRRAATALSRLPARAGEDEADRDGRASLGPLSPSAAGEGPG